MKATAQLLGSLREELPSGLGGDFEVLEGIAAAELRGIERSQATPFGDVFIRNKATGELIIVEVKGSDPNDELPFGVLPAMKRAKRLVETLHGKIVLVSTSIVSKQLREQLASEGITVVETSSSSQVIDEIRHLSLETAASQV
jgi:hypothetical protein